MFNSASWILALFLMPLISGSILPFDPQAERSTASSSYSSSSLAESGRFEPLAEPFKLGEERMFSSVPRCLFEREWEEAFKPSGMMLFFTVFEKSATCTQFLAEFHESTSSSTLLTDKMLMSLVFGFLPFFFFFVFLAIGIFLSPSCSWMAWLIENFLDAILSSSKSSSLIFELTGIRPS